jgi:hypothetical protein
MKNFPKPSPRPRSHLTWPSVECLFLYRLLNLAKRKGANYDHVLFENDADRAAVVGFRFERDIRTCEPILVKILC